MPKQNTQVNKEILQGSWHNTNCIETIIWLPIYSFIHSLIHSFFHSFTHFIQKNMSLRLVCIPAKVRVTLEPIFFVSAVKLSTSSVKKVRPPVSKTCLIFADCQNCASLQRRGNAASGLPNFGKETIFWFFDPVWRVPGWRDKILFYPARLTLTRNMSGVFVQIRFYSIRTLYLVCWQ